MAKKPGFIQRMLGRGWTEPEEVPPAPQPPPKPSMEIIPCIFMSEEGKEEVRFLVEGNKVGAVLADLAKVLGYRDANSAARVLRSKDLHTHRMSTVTGTREMIIVSESGMYRLIMRSNKPAAERFQDWVTEEVLPTIRREGSYPGNQTVDDKAPIRPWIKNRAKKYGFSTSWQKKRQKIADGNKAADAQTFAIGGDGRACSNRYNALYRGLFNGKTARTLKLMLGMRDKDSPIDRFSDVPQASYDAASSAMLKKMLDGEVSAENLATEAEAAGKAVRTTMLGILGPNYDFKPIENQKGHIVLDAVKKQIF